MQYKSRAGKSKQANSEFVIFFFFQREGNSCSTEWELVRMTTQRCDTHSSGSLISAPLWTFKLSAPAISKLLVPALLYFEEKWNTEMSRKWKVISCASSVNTKHWVHKKSSHKVTCKCHLPAGLGPQPQHWGWPPLLSTQEASSLREEGRVWYPGDKKKPRPVQKRFKYKTLSLMQHFRWYL